MYKISIYLLIVLNIILCVEYRSGVNSPIDIVYYGTESSIKYPANPFFRLDKTIYYHLNNLKFEVNVTTNETIMEAPDMGKAYVKIFNKTFTYDVEKIALKIPTEHTFERIGNDLELQIYHKLNGIEPDTTKSGDFDYRYLAISIRFSSIRDEYSHEHIIDQLVTVNETQKTYLEIKPEFYYFDRVTDIDLNRYTNFDLPYYYYYGTGTISAYKNNNVNWIILKNVNDMSINEFRKVQLALISALGTNFNSLTPKCSTYKSTYSFAKDLGRCSDITINYQNPKRD